jgi:hypothetical protein
MSAPPKEYMDGCTFGPKQFGGVKHTDICNQHDLDWWNERRADKKAIADFMWSYRLIKRHAKNTPYQPFAVLYASLGFAWLMTGGWFWWVGWVGPGKRMRD